MPTLPWLEEPLEDKVQKLTSDVRDLEDQIAELSRRLPSNAEVDLAQGHVHTNVTIPALVLITPASYLSIGVELGANAVTPASAVWPAANRAIFVPFVLPERVTVRQLLCVNGGTVSGNVDVGIYNSDLSLLISSGSTAQAGVNSTQTFDVTDTVLQPGFFYLAMAANNILATNQRWAPFGTQQGAFGVAQQASAFPLPASATLASVTSSYIPYIGLSLRAVV